MRPYEKPYGGIRKGVREFISDKTDIASILIGPADDIDTIGQLSRGAAVRNNTRNRQHKRGSRLFDRKMKGILRTNRNVNLGKKFE